MLKDLKQIQQNYFKAMDSNIENANKMVVATQNWLLILGLAELAFIGQQLIVNPENWFLKIIFSILLLGFISFIIGSIAQYKHVLKTGRYYHDLSKKTVQFIDATDKTTIEKTPEFLEDKQNDIKSSTWANRLISLSFVFILSVTLSLVIKTLFF